MSKKGGDYVSRGAAIPPTRAAMPAPGAPFPRRVRSDFAPADLPRDWGMAGAVGAYEVPSLAESAQVAFDGLAKHLRADPLTAIEAALNVTLMPAERRRVTAESFANGVLTLGLARRADAFVAGRVWVPRLQAELAPTLGRVVIRLTYR